MPTLATQGNPHPCGSAPAGSPVVAVIMVITGAAAIALPTAVGMGVLTLVAAVLLLAGVAHALYSLATRGLRPFAWHALIGLVYLGAGAWLLMNPSVGLASIALVIGVLFVVEGVLALVAGWATRGADGARWLLANGALTTLLGGAILVASPGASGAIIGLLVGVNLIVAGLSRLPRRHAGR